MSKQDKQVQDFYEMLGVPKHATSKLIQKAFRDLSRDHHPDVNPSPHAEVNFRRIADAYQVLKDTDRRLQLDAQIIASFCQELVPNMLKKENRGSTLSTDILNILTSTMATQPVDELKKFHTVLFPKSVKYQQLIIVGPTGSGKTKLINAIHAWPEDANLNLAESGWWKSRFLAINPRPIHLILPMVGHQIPMAADDKRLLEQEFPAAVDLSRIEIPPTKKGLFSTDWLHRFVFDFQLPTAETILQWQALNRGVTVEQLTNFPSIAELNLQIDLFTQTAKFLHLNNLPVFIRPGWNQPPMRFISPKLG